MFCLTEVFPYQGFLSKALQKQKEKRMLKGMDWEKIEAD
jgi:hypothetical protein